MVVAEGLIMWVHLVGASIWVGGSIFLGIVLVPVLKSHTKTLEEMVALMVRIGRRFNKITVPAFVALIATGIYNSRAFIEEPSTFFEKKYGIFLFKKFPLVKETFVAY